MATSLLKLKTITPNGKAALDAVASMLTPLGFVCDIIEFKNVANLFAHLSGGKGKAFSFCGHVDVVPAETGKWSYPPFGGKVANGNLYGRGAVDMKSAIGCFVAAAADFTRAKQGAFDGSISLMLTCDEEGIATNGIAKLMPYLKKHHKLPDVCLVGEPTCAKTLGDAMRVGRRGSLRLALKVEGKAGHSAWPSRADNPIPKMVSLLQDLDSLKLFGGDDNFPPDTMVTTKIIADGNAANVIPNVAEAGVNLRFGGDTSGKQWVSKIQDYLKAKGHQFKMTAEYNAEPFISNNEEITRLVQNAVKKHTNLVPEANCSGGTSDARFIYPFLSVVEFGLVGETMHKVDECCKVEDLTTLTAIYQSILQDFFAG